MKGHAQGRLERNDRLNSINYITTTIINASSINASIHATTSINVLKTAHVMKKSVEISILLILQGSNGTIFHEIILFF